MSELLKAIGTVVRTQRELLQISQEELSNRSELHRTYISDIERGSRNLSIRSLERLAQALDIPSWKILFLACEAMNNRIGAD